MSTFFPHLLAEAYSEVYKQDENDTTNIVLEYLVAEGYADDENEAYEIYEQLEANVISGILDEVKGCGGKVDPNNGKYKNGNSAKMILSPKEKTKMMARRREMEGDKPEHFRQAAKMRRIASTMREESEDYYDLVLEYLLDAGYADTEEAALKIMSNMSEEWKFAITGQSAE